MIPLVYSSYFETLPDRIVSLTVSLLLQVEDDLFPKRYEVANDASKLNNLSNHFGFSADAGADALEGIKVEEKLVNSILNDMFQTDDQT